MTQITFLMNSDPTTGAAAGNKFYKYAADYFTRIGAPAHAWPAGPHTLEEVFAVLRTTSPAPDVINIVSHATGFGTLDFALTKAALAAKRDLIGLSDLADALATMTSPGAKFAPVVRGNTQVALYGCDVGRNAKFVLMLGALFGGPARITAPRRVATFMLDATGTAQYRLSHSWSIPSKLLPPMPSPATSPLWPNFRTQFVQQAALIFGSKADQVRPLGSDDLRAALQLLVTKATDSSGDPSFFVEGNSDLTDAQVATLEPEANADPGPTGVPSTPQEVDDAWQATTLTKDDKVLVAGSAPNAWDVTVTVLTSVIDINKDVTFADPTSFCTWYSSPALAPGKPVPSISPNPASGGGGAPAPTGDLGSLIEQLLAAGLAQADLDPLLAALVPPTAGGADAMTAADPDVPPADDPDDDHIDALRPVEDV